MPTTRGDGMRSTATCPVIGQGVWIVLTSLTLVVLFTACGDGDRPVAPTSTVRDQPGALFTTATNSSIPLARAARRSPSSSRCSA